MSTGPTLPKKVKEALVAELDDLRKQGMSQVAIAQRIGMTQGAVSLALRGQVGRDFADAFCRAFKTDADALRAKWEKFDPAPHDDMPAVEFVRWVTKTPAVAALARDAEISVLDLLRVHRAPPRGGEADPAELKRHIMQLRRGDVGAIEGADIRAGDLEIQMKAAARKSSRR